MDNADSSLKAKAAKPPKVSEANVAGAAVVIRSAYDRSRVRVGLVCLASEDRTQQVFADESDINVLMKRFETTGIMPLGRQLPPRFADVTAYSFEESARQVAEVAGVFSQLDARTRARFENDPAVMLDFLSDPVNYDEAVRMGLMVKVEEKSDERGKGSAGAVAAGQSGAPGASVDAAGRDVASADRRAESDVAGGKAAGPGGPGGAQVQVKA